VELDVFSGRPNPTWALTAAEGDDLLARSKCLPAADEEMSAGLGYRGFIVYRTVSDTPQRWLHVGNGRLRIADQNQIRHYRDTEGIEEWLRQQAIARGYGALIGSPPE